MPLSVSPLETVAGSRRSYGLTIDPLLAAALDRLRAGVQRLRPWCVRRRPPQRVYPAGAFVFG